MEAVFLKLLNMSITASWIALAVILFRLVFRKAPKWIVCVLWALVGLRLLLPFSIESVISLIPTAEPIPRSVIEITVPDVNQGLTITPDVPDLIIPPSVTPETTAPVIDPSVTEPTFEFNVMGIVSVIWVVGVCAMLLYMLGSYLNVYNKVEASIKIRDDVYVCDNVKTPFILGVIKPRIFLPSSMSEFEIDYVVSHELSHIARHDHYWKPLGFLLLSVYWFNPIMWLAYVLLCRDIEFACDERVIRSMSVEEKKQYTTVLLNCSIPKKMIAACPLAFGEVGVKSRIKSVLNYKKPAFWIIILAIIASVVVAVCFLTNPVEKVELGQGEITLSPVEILYHNHINTTSEYTAENAPYYRINEDNKFYYLEKNETEWKFHSKMQKIELDESNFSARFHRDGESLYGKVCLIDNEALENILQNNKAAYQGWRDHESYQSFYMILEQNDGTYYVAYGNKENNASSENVPNGLIFLLYRVEKTDIELPNEDGEFLGDRVVTLSTTEFLYHSSYDIAESIMKKAQYFRIDKENRFYYLGEENSWIFGGDVYEIAFTEDELNYIFNNIPAQGVYETRGNLDAENMMQNNKKVYVCIKDNGSVDFANFYVILLQNDGTIYIIYGNESSETTIYFVCRAEETDKELPDKIYDGSIPNNGAQIFYFKTPIDEDNTEELKSAEDSATVKTFDNGQRIKLLKILKSNKFVWDAILDRITFEYDGVIDLYVGGEVYKIYFSSEHNVLYCNEYLCEISEFDMDRIRCAFSGDYDVSFAPSVGGINIRSSVEVDSTSGIYKDAINADKLDDENEVHFPVHRISSEKALREFIDKYGDELPLDDLKPVRSRYYQEFFDDNELFIIYILPNSMISYDFENLAVLEDNVLKFCFTQNGESVFNGPALVCVEKPKFYVSYFAAGFDAVVNKTPDQENNAVSLYTDVLTYKNPNELFPAAIYLTDSGLFTFNYSSLSSNIPMGRYEITNEKLILNADNGDVYVFSKVDGEYAFDTEASAKLPEYKISGDSNETYSPVPDGAVFYSNENSNVSPEEMLQISRKLAIAERTASYFTGYSRDVYGNESIEIDGVRYDAFKVYNTMRELVGITYELFDNELANTLINTQADGHPLFVEQNGRLYRFGGYVALERVDDAIANVYGVTKNSNGVYTVQTVIRSNDGKVVSGYEYHCIKSSDNYKFIDEFKLPIEVINDIRNK